MSDIAILQEMIKESSTVSLDGKKVVLIEPDIPGCSVVINKMPDKNEVIIIKVDNFKSPDTIFKGSKGECKRSDFVIIAETGDKKVMIFIEMKKTSDKRNDIIKQLTGSRCFIHYCKKIGKEFWNCPSFLEGYQCRFISINHISISKQRTQIDRVVGIHDSPDKMMTISSPNHLEFNHLAGRK